MLKFDHNGLRHYRYCAYGKICGTFLLVCKHGVPLDAFCKLFYRENFVPLIVLMVNCRDHLTRLRSAELSSNLFSIKRIICAASSFVITLLSVCSERLLRCCSTIWSNFSREINEYSIAMFTFILYFFGGA